MKVDQTFIDFTLAAVHAPDRSPATFFGHRAPGAPPRVGAGASL